MAAQIRKIRRKLRKDALATVAPSDFELGVGKSIDPSIINKNPNYSLYCFDEGANQAVFVRTPADVNVYESSFYYQAQFEHADAVLTAPYSELEAVLDDHKKNGQLIFIYSVGRCGSTLISRMLAETSGCLSISEPDVYTQLVETELFPEELRRHLNIATQCLLLSADHRKASYVALKFRSMAIEHAATMHELFLQAKMLFMYRNALQTARSGVRAYRYPGSSMSMLHTFYRVPLMRKIVEVVFEKRRSDLERLFPVVSDFNSRELVENGAAGLMATFWVSAMIRYLELREEEIPIVAFRYEDLVANPEAVLNAIFAYCDLPKSEVASALAALETDAQGGSVLDLKRQKSYELDDTARTAIDRVFQRSFPQGGPDFIAPGTIAV